MWDEIALKSSVDYDTKDDKIIRFEDWETNRTLKLANHALEFMLREVKSGGLLPLSFRYCDKQTKAPQLCRSVKEHVKAVIDAEFTKMDTIFKIF